MTTLPETTTASAQVLDEGTKGLRSKHLLSIEELSQEDIELMLDTEFDIIRTKLEVSNPC